LSRLAWNIVNYPERYVNNINENVRRDGQRVWMAWTNKPIFDDEGRVAEIGSSRSSPRGQRFTHSPQVRQRLSLTGSPRHTCRRTSISTGQWNEQMPHWTQRLGSGSTQAKHNGEGCGGNQTHRSV